MSIDIKQIAFTDDENTKKLVAGAKKITDVVKVTLGPKGNNVVIRKQFGSPYVTKDGVTVAKEIELEDPIEDTAAQLIKQASAKTADVAGDGTTTATILANSIYNNALKYIAVGYDRASLKRGISEAVMRVVQTLRDRSKDVEGRAGIKNVATISANGDFEIGELIAEAMDKVGKDGVITVEEAKSIETSLEVVEGLQFARGFISPHFVTDQENMIVEASNVGIFMYNGRITAAKDIIPVLQTYAEKKGDEHLGDHVLIICEDMDSEALTTCVINHVRRIVSCTVVKAPGFGDRRHAMLDDIAVLTGGEIVSEALGQQLGELKYDSLISSLGRCERIVVTRDNTTIVKGASDKKRMGERIKLIRKLISESSADFDRSKLQERLGKLTGGVAVLKVGAATEVEMKEKKDRVDDALAATRAAVEEGIVPGAGMALFSIFNVLSKMLENENNYTEGERMGIRAVQSAITIPALTIIENAGQSPEVMFEKLMANSSLDYGYDSAKGEFVNLIERGIVDPTKVVRCALENAASVASSLMSIEAIVYSVDRKEEKPQQKMLSM